MKGIKPILYFIAGVGYLIAGIGTITLIADTVKRSKERKRALEKELRNAAMCPDFCEPVYEEKINIDVPIVTRREKHVRNDGDDARFEAYRNYVKLNKENFKVPHSKSLGELMKEQFGEGDGLPWTTVEPVASETEDNE